MKIAGENNSKIIQQIAHGFEGDQEVLVKRRLRWIPFFHGCTHVLDLGCGPGLFLELLGQSGIRATGVEHDPIICQKAQGRIQGYPGLALFNEDATTFLKGRTDICDGIFLGHIIEHLDGRRGAELLCDCYRALVPGGKIAVLTPNPANLRVILDGFWLDISHIRPYPVHLLENMMRVIGFEELVSGSMEEGMEVYVTGRTPAK